MQPVRAQEAPIRGQLSAPVDIGGTSGAMAKPWLLGGPLAFQFPEQIVEDLEESRRQKVGLKPW